MGFFNQENEQVNKTVLKESKRKRWIIHGARATNVFLPPQFQRPTRDWDLWSRRSLQDSKELKDELNKNCPSCYCESSIPLEDSNQTVYRVVDCRTGHEVADFMCMPSKTKNLYKLIGGVRYETLEHAKLQYKEILNNPRLRHRHQKSLLDLQRIEAFERSLKKGEPIKKVEYPFRMFQFKPMRIGSW